MNARTRLGCGVRDDALLAASQPAAAATVTINAKWPGDAIYIHASAMLNADAAIARRVPTGYDRYTEFIPDLNLSRVVGRNGATITGEQSGGATSWLFKLPAQVTPTITPMAIVDSGLRAFEFLFDPAGQTSSPPSCSC